MSMKFAAALGPGEEETRAVREGLDEESLAIFDLLNKPDLSAAEIERIKAVSVDLLAAIKTELTRIDHRRDRASTRDSLLVTIHNYLWRDDVGLPTPTYTETDVDDKTAAVFAHVYCAYPTISSLYYPVPA